MRGHHRRVHEAARWFVRFQSRGDADRRPFFIWLRRTPQALEEYRAIEALWADLDGLRGDPDLNAEMRRSWPRTSAWPVGLIAGAMAAAVVVAVAVAASLPRSLHYVTEEAERSITLADGSQLALEPGSEVKVRMTRHRRDVRLVEGQASFEVTGDQARPFYVLTDAARLRVVGTIFDVRLDDDRLELTVREGRVRVENDAPEDVVAGERVLVDRQGIRRLSAADLQALPADQGSRLHFSATPLGEAVASINRQSSETLALADPSLSGLPISGVFADDDAATFARALQSIGLVRVERRGRVWVLHAPSEADPSVNF
ncbi:MAG: FecR domain-containing protein [Phenylobacterium sp.]|nr:FecR domain-containing protein [Phenylobacterium sp.]